MPPRMPIGGGSGGGASRAQAPGQDPNQLALQIKQLFDALGAQGMNPQAAPQQAPAQMDPSSSVDAQQNAAKLQNQGTQFGTYRPTVWAQMRGITGQSAGLSPTNSFFNQTQDALAPYLKSQMANQNANQNITFGNQQAQAQANARNQGIQGAQGALGAQAQGSLQLQIAKLLAGSRENVANINAEGKFNKPLQPTEQARLAGLQSLNRDLDNVEQLRGQYDLGSLLKYSGGLGFVDRVKILLGQDVDDQTRALATAGQGFKMSLQNLKQGHRHLITGRTLQDKAGEEWAQQTVPGYNPNETDAGFSNKVASMRTSVNSAIDNINNPRRNKGQVDNLGVSPMPDPQGVNRGTGETQDPNAAPLSDPNYGSQVGDMGGDPTAPRQTDKSQGVPRPARRTTVQRLLQKYK
jgi:hypothetical protein